MKSSSNSSSNSGAHVPEDVKILAEKVAALPNEVRGELLPLLEKVVLGAQRRHETLMLLREAITQLRLDMKYLIFDLEATRKERDANQIQ
ncbi:MAG: transcriptional regulator [Planctomycetia bacterium]|nr:transcriptional regulator [Planctomycetia bacterium]